MIWEPKRSDPLFLKHRRTGGEGYERLTSGAVDGVFTRLARMTGLVSEERMREADMDPARPHALRSGFASALKEEGVNKDVIDGLQGHRVGMIQLIIILLISNSVTSTRSMRES